MTPLAPRPFRMFRCHSRIPKSTIVQILKGIPERDHHRMTERNPRFLGDVVQLGRGLLMGSADIIPGVSGGTVALVLGIYERLVTAISHFDLALLSQVRRGEWSAAARHVDLRFLAALGVGILTGVGGLAGVIHYLLEHHHQHTLSAFFGLMVVSCFLVARMVKVRGAGHAWCLATIGLFVAAGAYWLVGLPFLDGQSGYGYLFFSGVIAISAMILPGVSGAFILLVLGKYAEVTGVIKDVVRLNITVDHLLTLGVFAAGCAVGLIGFSKFLRWLLARHESITMATLCGLMAGSLRRIWPFQTDTTPDALFKEKIYENYWPQSFDNQVLTSIGISAAAVVLVLAIDAFARRRSVASPLAPEDHATDAERR